MAKKTKNPAVTPEVHKFLSANGRKGSKIGGQVTRRYIELGKQAALENGEDVVAEVERHRRKAA